MLSMNPERSIRPPFRNHYTILFRFASPIIVQNVVTYDVVIEVNNKDLKLKPGMTANISIRVVHSEGGPARKVSLLNASEALRYE
jgi:hypothetical protein